MHLFERRVRAPGASLSAMERYSVRGAGRRWKHFQGCCERIASLFSVVYDKSDFTVILNLVRFNLRGHL